MIKIYYHRVWREVTEAIMVDDMAKADIAKHKVEEAQVIDKEILN